MEADSLFRERFNGRSYGILHWHQWDALQDQIRASAAEGWFVYSVGEAVPDTPVSVEGLSIFLAELDTLLRREHDESYCGIVYVDHPSAPTLVKVFDPGHLGSSCGSSGVRVLPGWVLSRMAPEDLQALMPPTQSRRRWWQRIWQS